MRTPDRLLPLLLLLLLGACAAPSKDASPPGAYVWSASMEKKRLALTKATADSGIAVLRSRDNQLQLNVPSDFSFDSGSAAIKPDMLPVLTQLAEDLELPAMSRLLILIVGHTDRRGPEDANLALSVARAQAVRKVLEAQGIAPARIAIEGRGESEPLVTSGHDYARELNRRVQIFLREPGG